MIEHADGARAGERETGQLARIDRAIRQAFILLDALDRRTLGAVSPALTTAQYHALTALALAPSQNLGELAARLLCDKANASGLIDRLSEQGLATRTRDPADKRRVALDLTPAGRDVLARAALARGAALHRALAPLTDSGLRDAEGVLEHVVDLLQSAVTDAQEATAAGETT